jgi:hypothetical protein
MAQVPSKCEALSSAPNKIPVLPPTKKKKNFSLGMVVYTCNPSDLGGRDQEKHSLKPAWGNSSWDPIFKKKKKNHKTGLVERLKV